MDWQAQLITLYLAVCTHWQEVGWVQAQRHAPYADLDFTGEEVVTIDLFAVALEPKRQIKDIHRHAGRYGRDGFPRLPGYGAYGQRLNRLADCFLALVERYRVHEANTLRRGLLEAGTRKPDLAVLNLDLPDGDGVDLIRDLRAWSGMPVLVLSARVEEYDKVEALDAGADDYLIKPFGVAELLARVRAVCRRHLREPGGGVVIAFGEVSVDLERRQVTRNGQPVHFTPIEFRLLATLITQPGKVLTHRQLLREVWGPAYVERGHYLRIYMGHIRQKLETDPARPRHFLTETDVGYRFRPF